MSTARASENLVCFCTPTWVPRERSPTETQLEEAMSGSPEPKVADSAGKNVDPELVPEPVAAPPAPAPAVVPASLVVAAPVGSPKASSRPTSAIGSGSNKGEGSPTPSHPQSAVLQQGGGGSHASSRPQSATASGSTKARGSDTGSGSASASRLPSRPESAQSRDWTRRKLSTRKKGFDAAAVAYNEPVEDMELDGEGLELATKYDDNTFTIMNMRRVIDSRNMRILFKKEEAHKALQAKIEAKIQAKEGAKAVKKEAKRLENIKNGVMPGVKKKTTGGGGDSDDDESEDESSDEEEDEEDKGGGGKDKAVDDNPFDEPTPEFVSSEKNRLEELVLNQVEDLKALVLKIVSTRNSREYIPEQERVARDFLKMHYAYVGDPQRDYFSVLPTFHQECEVNFGSGRIFKGQEDVAKALEMACGDVKLTYEVVDISIDKKIKRGLVLSFTATVLVSVDGDPPRRVMEIYDLKTSNKEPIAGQYVCSKLLTVLNDPRPLYVFSDVMVEKTQRDNMEPWARALMPPTAEELVQMQLDRENAETADMEVEDAVCTAIEMKYRYETKMAMKKEEALAEKERKAAMFGDDDDTEDGEEDEEEDGDEDGDKEGEEGGDDTATAAEEGSLATAEDAPAES